jgi:hypothetical protein
MGETLHLLSVRDGPEPAALARDGGGRLRLLPISGRFAWRLSGIRRCVGRMEGAEHQPCPADALVTHEPQCRACMGLEHPECVFEPRCQADPASCLCAATFRGVEHVAYLALFGTLPKVGMTQRWRIERRLREQGADAGVVFAGAASRGEARLLEKRAGVLFRVPEHRRPHELLSQMARPVPWPVVEARAREWQERLERAFPGHEGFHRLLPRIEHAAPQPMPGLPRRVHPHGRHLGTWLGAKGNHLFYQDHGAGRLPLAQPPVAALKRSDLVGRLIEPAGA